MKVQTLQVRNTVTNDLIFATGLTDIDDDVQFSVPMILVDIDKDRLLGLQGHFSKVDNKDMLSVYPTSAKYLVGDYTYFSVKIVDVDIK